MEEEVLWHRRVEVCDALWADDPDQLGKSSLVTGAPCGGPVATLRNLDSRGGGSASELLSTWTATGRPIASTEWPHGMRKMGWSSEELLVCALRDGTVRLLTAMCEEVADFVVDPQVPLEKGAWRVALWPDGVAVLTRPPHCSLYVLCSLKQRGDSPRWVANLTDVLNPQKEGRGNNKRLRDPCFCVIPSGTDDPLDVRVLIGTPQGALIVAGRSGQYIDLQLPGGPVNAKPKAPVTGGIGSMFQTALGDDVTPYISLTTSPGGRLIACLDAKGIIKILTVDDLTVPLDEVDLNHQQPPKQLSWCGDDCIVLYFEAGKKHVVFVVCTPTADPPAHQLRSEHDEPHYDSPLLLVPECDGCRILGGQRVECVERIYEIAGGLIGAFGRDLSTELSKAARQMAEGEIPTRQALQPLDGCLPAAVDACMEAASREYDLEKVRGCLEAALFGRAFVQNPSELDALAFVRASQGLRICVQLRRPPFDMPLTLKQLQHAGGPEGIARRLARRGRQNLALRICEWAGVPRDAVLMDWASVRIRLAPAAVSEQEPVLEDLFYRFRGYPEALARASAVALEGGKPEMAIRMVLRERDADTQIRELIRVLRTCDDANLEEVIRLVLEPACVSCHPELLNTIVKAARRIDEKGAPEAGARLLARICSEKASRDLRRAGESGSTCEFLSSALRRAGEPGAAVAFHEELGSREAALLASEHELLRAARSSAFHEALAERGAGASGFAAAKPVASSAAMAAAVPISGRRDAAALCVAAAEEQEQLLQRQRELEDFSLSQGWDGGPHAFTGLTLVATLHRLVEIGNSEEADSLRTVMKMPDKTYWRLKVKTLAAIGDLTELEATARYMQQQKAPSSLFRPVVEGFRAHGREDLAEPFVGLAEGKSGGRWGWFRKNDR